VPLVALAVPITDTVLAIVRRRQSGVPIFSPDKNHLHHRLLAAGLSQKQVVLVMYALTAFFSAAALLVVRLNPFLGVAVILFALGVFIFWAKKLGVMREVILPPSEKDEK
jgi:UDP-GlcNAc:undecaprenyl-phosphate GlcNAc-1-phosphate transferase